MAILCNTVVFISDNNLTSCSWSSKGKKGLHILRFVTLDGGFLLMEILLYINIYINI